MDKGFSLKSIDLFGKHYNHSFDREKLFKSSFGGLLSIMCFFVIIFSGIELSMTVFNRKIVNSISKIISYVQRPNLTFNVNVSYMIEDMFGNVKLDAYDYFDLEAYFYTLEDFKKGAITVSDSYIKNLTIKNCSLSDFNQENEQYFNHNNLKYGKCLSENILIGGYFDNPYNSWISIQLKEFMNTSNRICISSEEIYNYSQNVQFSVYYEKLNYNPINYLDPLSSYMTVKSYKIDYDLSKKASFFFQEFTISTDEGLVGTNFINQTSQMFETNLLNFKNRPDNDIDLIELVYYTSEFGLLTLRTYPKFQELLAQLATIFNIIFMLFDNISNFFYQKKMDHVILNKIFDIRTDDMDMVENSNKNFIINEFDITSRNSFKNNGLEQKNLINQLDNSDLNNLADQKNNPNNMVINNDNSNNPKINNDLMANNYLVIRDNPINDIDLDEQSIKKDYLDKKIGNAFVLDDKNRNEASSISSNIFNQPEIKLVQVIKKENVSKDLKFKITLIDFIKSKFCKCLIKKDNLIKNLAIYHSLIDYVSENTDILKFVEIQNEIEKLKYFLFDETELANFNWIEKPQNPLKQGHLRNVSKMFKLSRNFSELKSITYKSNQNKRLIELLN